MRSSARVDLRAARTRDALLAAFFVLVQEGRYEEVRVSDIAARASVSRSAFYAHFAGKDALLAASIAGPFAILAATLNGGDSGALVGLLEHFWSNRALARSMFREPVRRRVVVVLTAQVERILADGRGPLCMPNRLAAIQLAEMLFAPVEAWLAGRARCSAATLAAGLGRTSRAALAALTVR